MTIMAPSRNSRESTNIRNRWVSEPSTPERLAEAVARSVFAILVYVVALFTILVWAGATTDWFAGLGLIVPLFWLLDWVFPDDDCEQS